MRVYFPRQLLSKAPRLLFVKEPVGADELLEQQPLLVRSHNPGRAEAGHAFDIDEVGAVGRSEHRISAGKVVNGCMIRRKPDIFKFNPRCLIGGIRTL